MAEYNAILTGALPQVAARRLQMQTPTPFSTVAPELMPVLDLERRPEYWRLQGGVLAWGMQDVAADVATVSQVQLKNPASSGVLLVCEQIIVVHAGAAATYQVGVRRADLATNNGNRSHRDLRAANLTSGGQGGVVGQVRSAQAALANDGFVAFLRAAADQTLIWQTDVVIPPGWGVVVHGAAVNQSIIAGFTWRERPVSQSELV